MARPARTRRAVAQLAFDAISIEGALLSPEWLSAIAQLAADRQAAADYRIPKGLDLRDEVGRYWRIARAHWADLEAARAAGAAGLAASERFVLALLREALGFGSLVEAAPAVLGERTYPVRHRALEGRVPVVIAPLGAGLDALAPELGEGDRRRSAFGLTQEALNADEAALWGITSDGLTLRVLRDNASLTRPAWIEADLERIFREERFADFSALWLLAHETRFGAAGQAASECALEAWRNAGQEAGTRARERLRDGVEDALVALGQGFLVRPENSPLRDALQTGKLTKEAYFQQLLRLVYRLIFLLVAEERGVLHPDGADPAARARYEEGYGLRRLRDRSVRRSAHDRFTDVWEALQIVFRGLGRGEPRLALPALGGLFAEEQCAALDVCALENRALLTAVFKLSWLKEPSGLSRVNWRDMGPEELGSVYESLLELVPVMPEDGRGFAFAEGAETKGNARKTTGSYYTPDSLVQVLLDSALEPVVQSTIAANPKEPAEALLRLAVVDPACGSGHFLLSAAHRLAAHVARLRAGGTATIPQHRHALREVVSHCLYGVDLNPMAVELCRVSLWMVAVEPGRPLSFLDSHIQLGNALLGTTPELMAKGIPDEAWEPIEGDDKKTARLLKARNKKAAEGQRGLDLWATAKDAEPKRLEQAVADLDAASDAELVDVAQKTARWNAIQASPEYRHQKLVADAWCAAFVWPKPPIPEKKPGKAADEVPPIVAAAPTNELWRQLRDGQGTPPVLTVKSVHELADQYRFFHWHLAFPQVFAKGGFDVVVGNPPWERLKLQEQEWFAARQPEIAAARNAAARRTLIATLRKAESELSRQFAQALRVAEGEPFFLRSSGAYPMCGVGRDINTAAVFLELMRRIVGRAGLVGCLCPASSVLGDTTKDFVRALVERGELRCVWHFENEEMLFSQVHHAFRFAIAILAGGGSPGGSGRFVFYARNVTQLRDDWRVVSLCADHIATLNPVTRTLAAFRSGADARLALAMHKRVPLLGASTSADGLPWEVATRPGHYHMANDAELFAETQSREAALVPLYESKMIGLYDHRFGTYEGQTGAQANQGKLPETSDEWHASPHNNVRPRYWVPSDDLRARSNGIWSRPWRLVFREITSATSERTAIGAIVPEVATGHTLMLVASPVATVKEHLLLLAAINSLPCDYLVRQKVNGTHLVPSVFRQVPVPSRCTFNARAGFDPGVSFGDWICPRGLELTYTSWELEPFSFAIGHSGPPFVWHAGRRFLLDCEVNSAFFHLYGVERADVNRILDSFPVLQRNDEKAHGEYRTKRVILEIYDQMADAIRTGRPYQTRLDPPPADPRVAHPPRTKPKGRA